MKSLKLISTLGILLFTNIYVFGQDSSKIKIQIGGLTKLDFSSTKIVYENSDGNFHQVSPSLILNLSPSIGFLFRNGIILGVELPLSYSKETDMSGSITELKSISFAPYGKYYIGAKSLKPFIYLTYGKGFASQVEDNHSSRPIEFNLTLFGIYGGLAYFFKHNVSLEFSIGYGYESIIPKESIYYSYYSTTTSGINTRIGLNYTF
jgi:hypothetical protein